MSTDRRGTAHGSAARRRRTGRAATGAPRRSPAPQSQPGTAQVAARHGSRSLGAARRLPAAHTSPTARQPPPLPPSRAAAQPSPAAGRMAADRDETARPGSRAPPLTAMTGAGKRAPLRRAGPCGAAREGAALVWAPPGGRRGALRREP